MMDEQHLEVEVKLYVPDLRAVAGRLEALGARLSVPRIFERNIRYDDADRAFTPAGIALRLRKDSRTRLTYKHDAGVATGAGIHARFEAEVEVSDFDTMHLILEKLGYRPYLIYEKYRTTYEFGGAEIVLDELPYGNFVEIEGAVEAIEATIARLGLDNARRYGYSYVVLFDVVRQHLKLDFTDLTFENFAGIDVPENAFNDAR